MAGIFISYRRAESKQIVLFLRDRLRAQFGANRVFVDVSTIRGGAEYRQTISDRLASCEGVLAIIGPRWGSMKAAGARRLDNARDFVRIELSEALKAGKVVMPVLLDGTAPPKRMNLPRCLWGLAERQASKLRTSTADADVARLIARLKDFVTSDHSSLAIEQAERLVAMPSAEESRRGIRLLAECGARDRLAAHMNGSIPFVKWEAAKALAKLREVQSAEPLVQGILRDQDPRIPDSVTDVLELLSGIGTHAVPAPVRVARLHPDTYVRCRTAQILGALKIEEPQAR